MLDCCRLLRRGCAVGIRVAAVIVHGEGLINGVALMVEGREREGRDGRDN